MLTKYTYELNGNLEQVERQADEAGTTFQTTTYTYTTLDQLKTITDTQGHVTTFQYDANGNRIKIIDAELKATTYLYDERDLLFQVTDANTGVTTDGYDANGNLTSLKDANTNTTTYAYDEFDRLKDMTYPDGTSKESYTYDAASNLKTKTDPKSQVITYAYDALNRLTFKEYVGCTLCGGNVDYQYDNGSRLKKIGTVPGVEGTVPTSTIQYQYDSLNRAKQVTTTLNSTPYPVSYQYDAAGNRTQLTYPNGTLIKYTYDALNRLDTITDSLNQVLFDFGYDTLSRRTSLSRPNGISTSYTYDTLNRLTQIQHGSIATISYPLYDQVGNRKQMTDSQGTHHYGYNNLYELTSVTGALSASYAYDPLGNRTTASAPNTPSSYTPNPLNQYSQVDSTAYTYDLNGNLTSDGTRTYSYDFENRLIHVKEGVNTIAQYQYDPFGRRLTKTTSTDTFSYLYDGEHILETFPCNLTLATCSLPLSFLNGPGIDEPLEMLQHPSTTTYYYHQDGLGSVVSLSNASGSAAETYSYDPYGIPSSSSTFGNPFLFTGREYDAETGLYYYRSRYYSPKLGRFISRDAQPGRITDPSTLVNKYAYVANNPLNWLDPFGWDKEKPWWEKWELYLIEVGAEMEKGYMTNMQGLIGTIGVAAGAYSSIGNIPRGIGYGNRDLLQGGRIAYRWANQYGSGIRFYSFEQIGAFGSTLSIISAAMTGWTIGETINAYYWGYQNYKQKYGDGLQFL